MEDLIHNPAIAPSFDEISGCIDLPIRAIWIDLNIFIQETFQAKPKIMYSTCAGKPGWNVKYQKSGKAICTLYPEKDCLIALVVIKEEMAGLLNGGQPSPHPLILRLVQNGKPFNHTFWLMIPVGDTGVLEGVKDLLVQKQRF
jgi:hypothetical protein